MNPSLCPTTLVGDAPFATSSVPMVRASVLVEPVLALEPSLGSGVDLPCLASSSSKQQQQQQQQAGAKWGELIAPSWCFRFG